MRLCLVPLSCFAIATSVRAQAWRPDLGDGQYRNPIIFADYSDPDVIRVGEDFFMVSSSFGMVPGLPILQSHDLVNWRIVGHAIRRLPPAFDRPQHGNGVWAPSLRYHAGAYYIYYGDPDRGVFMVKGRDVRGPWDPPVLVKAAKGWEDPCPLWDDDGNAYLVHAFAGSRAGIKSVLHVNRLSPDGTRVLDEGTLVFDGHAHHPTIEGPKLYKRNGWYYIFAPAGGVTSGWQTVLRSRHPLGPYEDRVVLAQGKTAINGPHQGAWISLANGESWFVHFQDRGAYGRVTLLEPMRWSADDWPVIGVDPDGDGIGEPVLTFRKPTVAAQQPPTAPQTSDEFDAPRLGLQWQWQANDRADWYSLTERSGHLRLVAQPLPADSANLWFAPNLLLQKLPAPTFTATTRVALRPGTGEQTAGLVVLGMDYAYVALHRSPRGVELVHGRVADAPSGTPDRATTTVPIGGSSVFLRVTVGDGASCRFAYSADGRHWTAVGDVFQARQGRWVGATMGLFAERPSGTGSLPAPAADFDFFRVR
jgi:beta-xylosidase